jgi:hypothetical protein
VLETALAEIFQEKTMNKINGGLMPGLLGGRVTHTKADTDAGILSEVARMTASEFTAKYIKGPNAQKNMEAYNAAKAAKEDKQ